MRNILIAAAFAVGGLLACGPALAQQGPPSFQPGGPNQVAGWCKVTTDPDYGMNSYGYYQPCPGTSMAYAPRPHRHR
jgi:hypothetical protein